MMFCFFMALCMSLFSDTHGSPYADTSVKKALIFGISGQDGTYLKEFLLSKNYEVHGVSRSTSSRSSDGGHYFAHVGDVSNATTVFKLIQSIQPDEIYNLAGQSAVKASFDSPEETAKVNSIGTLQILEAIRLLGLEKKVKFFQAASSEMFGLAKECPQTEKTPFHPRSPYGVSKLYSYWITVNYREAYGIFGCNGILFNHESPHRGEGFVTRKITQGACRYKLGLQDILYLGNLEAKRDWGYAKDYVEAMWLMLQQENPDDYVVATGEMHSVRDFVESAFESLGIEIEWKGKGLDECGIDKSTGKVIVMVDPKYYRPCEIDFVQGDCSKAAKILNWKPKTKFSELLKIMVEADYRKESMALKNWKASK